MKIAIIPARGGSQGIHKKNLCDLGGKPLLWWTLNAALESKKIDKVFVTTDDKEIADYSSSMGVEVIVRPENISGSTASSESAIAHALD
jgi:CMP-N-acetylneuraminic acid synthetase